MPRQTVTKELTYNERLALWEKNECPYCGWMGVTCHPLPRGAKHYTCHNKECRAENHFSRPKAYGTGL